MWPVVGTVFLAIGLMACGGSGSLEDAAAPQDARVIRDLTTQATLRAPNADPDDFFGHSVAVSSDGTTIAVGAPWEDSAANGVNGDAADNTVWNSGAVYVFTRAGSTWSQEAYIKPPDTRANMQFGWSLSFTQDGNTLAIGTLSGSAAYVATRTGGAWSISTPLTGSNAVPTDLGRVVGLSSGGDMLMAGSLQGTYVFERSGTTWIEQAVLATEVSPNASGAAIAANGSRLVAGPRIGAESGSLHVADRTPGGWISHDHGTSPSVHGCEGVGNLWLSADGRVLRGATGTSTALVCEWTHDGVAWSAPVIFDTMRPVATASSPDGEHIGWAMPAPPNMMMGTILERAESWEPVARFAGLVAFGVSHAVILSLSHDGSTVAVGTPGDYRDRGAVFVLVE
ncbi:MAG: hypothetical protein SFX73_22085 [Kofleriaceae bacterium]|nr:hypothetical protein [Kofleriaceae bacterium]